MWWVTTRKMYASRPNLHVERGSFLPQYVSLGLSYIHMQSMYPYAALVAEDLPVMTRLSSQCRAVGLKKPFLRASV